MPSSRVKDFAKNFNPGKVIAVRLRRFAKNARTRRNSTTTRDHEGDDSISADVPSEFPAPSSTLYSNSSLLVHPGSLARDPGLEVSINISSATSSHRGESSAHKASDMAQTFLPFVQSVAGAIPLAGPPMQATISGLLSILQAIDRRSQNKADLDRLTLRLHQLSSHLCNVPTPQGPFEQYRRDAIIRMLQDISAQVAQLYNRGLAHTSVTQAIIGCSSEIDRYLVDYSWSSQMQSHHDILEVRKTLERQQEILMRIESVFLPGRSSVGRIVTLGFVTLVDATDRSHPIPMDVCDSFERFNEQLQLLFKHNSVEARIQRQYMEEEQYDLCIDDDKQVTRLTSCEWPSIAAGTTIVMRVIFEQKKSSRVDYRCHFCGAVNDVGTGSIMHSLQRQAGCSINCRVCKRRFQISCGSSSAKRSTQSSNIDCVPRTEAEMHLIRNFHIQQMLSRSQLPCVTSSFDLLTQC
ncbi:hypothetical protein DFJ58DRAFT_166281 [Suillus subalutaceus]|uniref:uncharacterized protein n=1 Tax=Suillus subalutaceus TaxID=48586 RepID=UPI001B865BD4|nr:uncharacterized protein DFJ58DRAFT_166281 [Suillus subalutaceus]KAG1865496.1 hypothetical protein DFJ58DRAFT_166281 [Suillus subalutaceus]